MVNFRRVVNTNGLELKIARIRAGLSLWQLGQEVGIHPARISEMERNQRPINVALVNALDLELAEALKVGA